MTRATTAIEKAETPDINQAFLSGLVGYALRRASNAAVADFAATMQTTGLRPALASILSIAEENPGIRQGLIGEALGIARANLAPLIGELEERGLVRRLPDALDGRAFAVHLTPKGLAAMRTAKHKIKAHEEKIFRRLSAEDRQRLIDLLRQI